MRMRTIYTHKRGVSLVELLVAVAILAVALTPLLAIFLQSLKMSEKAYKMSIATNLARDLAEEIRSQYFWEPYYSLDAIRKEGYFPMVTTFQPFGLDTNGLGDDKYDPDDIDGHDADTNDGRFAYLDDVDDYDGWCRGKDCETFCTTETTASGICKDESYLETYDGFRYNGSGGYPWYADFTRKVEVFNIYANNNADKSGPADAATLEHDIAFKTSTDDKTFLFYDLREANFPNLTTRGGASASGRTRLKVVKVTVEYTGPITPPITVEDLNLVSLPISE